MGVGNFYPRGANGIWRIRSYCLSAENNFLIHINEVRSLLVAPSSRGTLPFPFGRASSRAYNIYIGIDASMCEILRCACHLLSTKN